MRADHLKMLEETMRVIEEGYCFTEGERVDLKLSPEKMRAVQVLLPKDVKDICGRTDFQRVFVMGRCGIGCVKADSFLLCLTVRRNSTISRNLPAISQVEAFTTTRIRRRLTRRCKSGWKRKSISIRSVAASLGALSGTRWVITLNLWTSGNQIELNRWNTSEIANSPIFYDVNRTLRDGFVP